MKCRICGYELDGSTLFCPMCGSKVEAADIAAMHTPAKEEFTWNTCDFPKPRQMRDIKMEWNGSGTMKEDASEGFVQTDILQPVHTAEKETHESAPAPAATWHMPEQKVADNTPLWETQPLWDANHLPKELQEASMPEERAFTARGYIRMNPGAFETPFTATGRTNIAESHPEAQPDSTDASEKSIPEIQEIKIEAPTEPVPEKTPEKFNTFVSKNEEFQQLLEEQWNRAALLHNEDTFPHAAFNNALSHNTSVSAPDVSAFEEMLNAGTTAAEEFSDKTIPINLERIHKELNCAADISHIEGISPLSDAENQKATIVLPGASAGFEDLMKDSRNDVSKVRDTIETRIREIREKEAEENRRKGSKAMADARLAYFGAIEKAEAETRQNAAVQADPAPVQPQAAVPVQESVPAVEPVTRVPEEIKDAPVTGDTINVGVVADVEPKPERDTNVNINLNINDSAQQSREQAYQQALDEVMRQEPEPVKVKKRHGSWFGTLLIVILLVVVVFEAVVMGLRYFIPDNEITQFANYLERMVIDTLTLWFNKALVFLGDLYRELAEAVVNLMDKYL